MKAKALVFLAATLFLTVSSIGMAQSLSVNVDIGAPPPLEFAAPPDLVVVPSESSEVYLVPNTVGLYFFDGYWYRIHAGHWFRSISYTGPFVGIDLAVVPLPVVVIPPDYILAIPPGYHRIHYGEFHSHWRDWGRTHYWNAQPWYRDHSAHHWGGREFVRPSVDVHRSVDIQRGGVDMHRSVDVNRGNVKVERNLDIHRGGTASFEKRVNGGSALKSRVSADYRSPRTASHVGTRKAPFKPAGAPHALRTQSPNTGSRATAHSRSIGVGGGKSRLAGNARHPGNRE